MGNVQNSKSLEELEGVKWPEPPASAAPFLRRCYLARKKRISELSLGEIRLLVGQGVGLDFVMPLALKAVEEAPLVETDHFCGDLLVAVLEVPSIFYQKNIDYRSRIEKILSSLPNHLEKLDLHDFDTASEELEKSADRFREGA